MDKEIFIETSYFLKRIIYQAEDNVVELISVTKEWIVGDKVSFEILASSLKEIPLSQMTKREILLAQKTRK